MTAINAWFEKTFLPTFAKIGSQRHLVAIRRTFLLIIPLVLIGSIFTMLPGIPGLDKLLGPFAENFQLASNATFGLISIYIAFALSYNLAASYKLDAVSVSLAGVIAFAIATFDFKNIEGILYADTTWLGTWGMFGAIVISIYTVELYRFFVKRGVYFKPPSGVPEGIGKFIQSILPLFILILPLWILTIVGVKIATLIGFAFRPLLKLADTYPAFLVALFIEHLTWYVGVHSWAAIGPAYFPFLVGNNMANAEAYAAGQPLPHIGTFSAYFGGAGGGTGNHVMLAVFGLFSRSKTLKAVAQAGIVPTLFNVNEPILFGYPVVLNPVYFIPHCIFGPLIRSLTWLLVAAGWVARSHIMFFAFVPGPFIWYLSNLDWRVFIWGTLISYILPGLAYYPFFKMHEKMVLEEEAAAEAKLPVEATATA